MNTWLIIRTPGAVHCWDLGEVTVDEQWPLINAARVATGFPTHDNWPFDRSGYDLSVTRGTPHPTLLAEATVGSAADLQEVNRAQVDAHIAARAGYTRELKMDAARTALAVLEPADREIIVAGGVVDVGGIADGR